MTVRNTLVGLLEQCAGQNGAAPETPEAVADAYRDEVALDLGRDLLRDGLAVFLVRLVGQESAAQVLAGVRREDAATVRAAKLREPQGYDDGRLNRALERVAEKIERGRQ